VYVLCGYLIPLSLISHILLSVCLYLIMMRNFPDSQQSSASTDAHFQHDHCLSLEEIPAESLRSKGSRASISGRIFIIVDRTPLEFEQIKCYLPFLVSGPRGWPMERSNSNPCTLLSHELFGEAYTQTHCSPVNSLGSCSELGKDASACGCFLRASKSGVYLVYHDDETGTYTARSFSPCVFEES
jgi:hypothetical protein